MGRLLWQSPGSPRDSGVITAVATTAATFPDESAPAGYVVAAADCNDASATVYPGATETCNSIDDNCDGVIDEGTTHVIATPDDTTPLTTQTLLARGEVDALLNPNALWVLAADWAAVAPDAQLAFMSATLLQMSGAVLDGVEWIIFAGRPITDDDLIALAETLR